MDHEGGASDAAAAADEAWFLPGPPGWRGAAAEADTIEAWRRTEAGLAPRLAEVAGRLGALDERLRRGPEGWRRRLALTEAAALSWQAGERVTVERLGLWLCCGSPACRRTARGWRAPAGRRGG